MKELTIGDKIHKGDLLLIDGKYYPVTSVGCKFCVVTLNKRSQLQLPAIYSEDFHSEDTLDNNDYRVFRK